MSILFKHKFNWQTSFVKASAVKYAIGEVILIFIGITLAIAFNNWNEERKQKAEGREYLKTIYHNIRQDTMVINDHIKKLESHKLSSRRVLELMDDPNGLLTDSVSFMDDLRLSSTALRIGRSLSTFEELLQKGMIHILNDDSLINIMQSYFLQYDFIITRYNELPKAKRLEMRILSGGGIDLMSLDNYWLSDTKSAPSKTHVETLKTNADLRLTLYNVNISSHFIIEDLKNLKSQAQSIISYMEEHLADILNEK